MVDGAMSEDALLAPVAFAAPESARIFVSASIPPLDTGGSAIQAVKRAEARRPHPAACSPMSRSPEHPWSAVCIRASMLVLTSKQARENTASSVRTAFGNPRHAQDLSASAAVLSNYTAFLPVCVTRPQGSKERPGGAWGLSLLTHPAISIPRIHPCVAKRGASLRRAVQEEQNQASDREKASISL